MSDPEADRLFETEVRRVADGLWPGAEGGSTIEAGKERDGVYVTEEVNHLIECTTSRLKDKAVKDIEKLVELSKRCRRRDSTRLVKAWFITREDPTADQRDVAKSAKEQVTVLSFERFRAKLVDAAVYLEARTHYPFGSARNPATGDTKSLDEYTELALGRPFSSQGSLTASEVASKLLDGDRFILLGDYGSGKSMTMREVYLWLRKRYLSSKSFHFPILLNLRDHHGQRIPAEAIERHARNIGFGSPAHLVRAWRAGYTTILLDGFDEIASPGWATQRKQIQRIRYDSVELIRSLVRDTPTTSGILLAGREHFFDSSDELEKGLGTSHPFQLLRVEDLSDQQLRTFLGTKGWDGRVPSWLPSRPLLLGYLASRGLLQATLEVDAGSAPAVGWDALLNRICEREAEIEAGIDGSLVRQVIERLATHARTSHDGLGPISFETIKEAFGSVCGYEPDDKATVLLQRLPGLGRARTEDGTRAFIDGDLAGVARAGDPGRFIVAPHDYLTTGALKWACPIGALGSEVAALEIFRKGVTPKQLTAAIGRASTKARSSMLVADLVTTAMVAGISVEATVYIHEALIEEVDLSDNSADLSRIEFHDCSIRSLIAPADVRDERFPRFVNCVVDSVDGRVGKADLPAARFEDCEFYNFTDQMNTNNAILSLSIPGGVRVLFSVLRKLFVQKGSGRRENALLRGMDQVNRAYVAEVLILLQREGLVCRTTMRKEVVWLPERSAAPRIGKILKSPATSEDPLVVAARKLT